MSTVQVAELKVAVGTAASTVQVAQIQVTAIQRTTVQVAQLVVRSGLSSTVQVSQITVGIATGSRVQVAELQAVATLQQALQARAGLDQTVIPFQDVIVDGRASTGNPTSYRWTQIANGAPVQPDFPSDSNLFTYRPVPSLQTYTVVMQLTVSDGVTVSTDQRVDTVYACTSWQLANGVWRGIPRYLITGVPPNLPPFVTVSPATTVSLGDPVTLIMSAGDADGYVVAYRWKPKTWPSGAVAPILLTPDQPTTTSLPLVVAGTYIFEATATDSSNLVSPPVITTVTVGTGGTGGTLRSSTVPLAQSSALFVAATTTVIGLYSDTYSNTY